MNKQLIKRNETNNTNARIQHKFKTNNSENYKEAIINEYKARTSNISQMATKYGLNQSTIINSLKKWGIPKRKKVPTLKTRIINKNKDLIIKLYTQKKLTGLEIAKKLKLAEPTIHLKLKEWGIKARKYQKLKPGSVIEMSKQGFNTKEIAEMFNSDSGSVSKVLRKYGIKLQKKTKISKQEKEIIKQYYTEKNYSIPKITQIIKQRRKEKNNPSFKDKEITTTIIYSRIKEWNLKRKPTNKRLETKQEEITNNFLLGKTINRISKELEIPKEPIYKLLEKNIKPTINSQKEITNELKTRIINLRKQGIAVREIAIRTRVTTTIVQKIVNQIPHQYHNKKLDIEKEKELAEQIKNLRTNPRNTKIIIANKLAISTSRVGKIIEKYQIPKTKKYSEDINKLIILMYHKGIHPQIIAQRLNLTTDGVRQQLRILRINQGSSPWSRNYSYAAIQKQNELIKKFYGPKYRASITQISKTLKLDKTTIRARMKKMGIPIRSASEIREYKKRKINRITRLTIAKQDRKIIEKKY